MQQAIITSDRADALRALNSDQRKRLAAFAHICAKNTGEGGDDLLSMANLRWLGSSIPVQGPDQTFNFLCGAISSIKFDIFRHQRVHRKSFGIRAYAKTTDGNDDDTDPVEQVIDEGASQETAVFMQQLYDLCGDDDDVKTMILYNTEQASMSDIQAETGWDDKKYEAIRKRKLRKIARWKLEGRLG